MSKATILINGVIGKDTTLVDVIAQYKAFKDVSELDVIIKSVGGYVEEGKAIREYFEALEVPVTTIAIKAYSVAAEVFMSGDDGLRLISAEAVEKPFMIHNPLAQNVTGGAEVLESFAAQLRVIGERFVSFYSERVSDIPSETLTTLLDNETYLTGQEAVDLGFANGIQEQLEAVAMFNNSLKEKNLMTKLETMVQAIAKKLGLNPEAPEAEAVELTDGTGEQTVDFYELEEGDSPTEGSKARVDGADAEGSIVMPSGETYVFEEGVLKTIEPKEDEEGDDADASDDSADVEAQAAEIAEINKWEMSVVNESFAVGDKVEHTPYEEGGDPTGVAAGEYELEDGRKILVDGDSIIQIIKEAPSGASDDSADSDDKPAVEANEDTVVGDEATIAVITALQAQITKLKAEQSSASLDDNAQPEVVITAQDVENMTPLERHRYYKKNF